MGEITITGQVDRLERDENGAAIVVEGLKTGNVQASHPTQTWTATRSLASISLLYCWAHSSSSGSPSQAALSWCRWARPRSRRASGYRPNAACAAIPTPEWAPRAGRDGRRGHGRSRCSGRRPILALPGLPGRVQLPGRRTRRAGDRVTTAPPLTAVPVRYSPAQLARMLGAQEPTAEQAAVIGAPLTPLAVIAGAGSGKSETMAARLVWLVANQLVRPERVLGLTFTRKAAAELADRVRIRLAGLRRAGLPLVNPGPATGRPAQAASDEPAWPGRPDRPGWPGWPRRRATRRATPSSAPTTRTRAD